jgi:hypothetical protein
VRLHGRGTPASEAEVRAAAHEVAGGPGPAAPEAAPPRTDADGAPARRETLVDDLL